MSAAVPTTPDEAKRLKAIFTSLNDDHIEAIYQLRSAMAVAVAHVPPAARAKMFADIEAKARSGEL